MNATEQKEQLNQVTRLVDAHIRDSFKTPFGLGTATTEIKDEVSHYVITFVFPKGTTTKNVQAWFSKKKLSYKNEVPYGGRASLTITIGTKCLPHFKKELSLAVGKSKDGEVADGNQNSHPADQSASLEVNSPGLAKPVVAKVPKPDLSDKFFAALDYIKRNQGLLFADPRQFISEYLEVLIGVPRKIVRFEVRDTGYRIYVPQGSFNEVALRSARELQHDCGLDQLGYFLDGPKQPENILWFAPRPVAQFQDEDLLADMRWLIGKYNLAPQVPLEESIRVALTGGSAASEAAMMIQQLKATGYLSETSFEDRINAALSGPSAQEDSVMMIAKLKAAGRLPVSFEAEVDALLAGDSIVGVATMLFERLAAKQAFPNDLFGDYVVNALLSDDDEARELLKKILVQLQEAKRLAGLLQALGFLEAQDGMLQLGTNGFTAIIPLLVFGK